MLVAKLHKRRIKSIYFCCPSTNNFSMKSMTAQYSIFQFVVTRKKQNLDCLQGLTWAQNQYVITFVVSQQYGILVWSCFYYSETGYLRSCLHLNRLNTFSFVDLNKKPLSSNSDSFLSSHRNRACVSSFHHWFQ